MLEHQAEHQIAFPRRGESRPPRQSRSHVRGHCVFWVYSLILANNSRSKLLFDRAARHLCVLCPGDSARAWDNPACKPHLL